MKWSFFPRNIKIPKDLTALIAVFESNSETICSFSNQLHSDDVLNILTPGLKQLGYIVEASKRETDKIKVPVLYGECGIPSLCFEADAYNEVNHIVVEVEAERAVTNYQFLKDLFEACCMDEAEYLCVAVREIYRRSMDYQKVCEFFDAMYSCNKFIIPLKGILLIGY